MMDTLEKTQVLQAVLKGIYLFKDTCNVYILRSGHEAVLVDFGSGDVLDHLAGIDVDRVTDVVMTHHHRDQGQGLARAAAAGIRIWVPHCEQDLFHSVDHFWQARELYVNYNTREDRFSLLELVQVAGTLRDYETRRFGDLELTVLPTPGHTPGSISLLMEQEGQRILFSGDLINGPGRVVSLAATQWTYNGAEGVAASLASLMDLEEKQLDLLLPSHGLPMDQPGSAISLLKERFRALLEHRKQYLDLHDLREHPYEEILPPGEGRPGAGTPPLLMNRTSMANSYVLVSASGKALLIDFGYDFMTGVPAGSDRASRRPWLYTIPALKSQYHIQKVDAVILTHYHDDHVAGCNLLRSVEGTQVWAAENFAEILEHPADHDLPCLWYDPIPVNRVLPLEQPIQWEEYTLKLHPLHGHTRYAVAVEFEKGGLRVLATGDEYQGDDGLFSNYVYQNRFSSRDFKEAADLYLQVCPNLILSGHWKPLVVTQEYLREIAENARTLEQIHRDLLPDELDAGEEGFIARIKPYQFNLRPGKPQRLTVEVTNPFPDPAEAVVRLVTPPGWKVIPEQQTLLLQGSAEVAFTVQPPPDRRHGPLVRRLRLAADIIVAGRRFGQQAEALATIG
jgi:glyoxylase-like metal-dependent hydrolase (beta-lactamase superfamily II)